MTSLDLHSWCRGPLALDGYSSGWFWDTGVIAIAFNGGDHWSPDGPIGSNTWADLALAPLFNFNFEMFSLVETSV